MMGFRDGGRGEEAGIRGRREEGILRVVSWRAVPGFEMGEACAASLDEEGMV